MRFSMANKRRPITFPELDDIQPKGRGAILRTPEEIEAENQEQAVQHSGNQENQNAVNPGIKKTSIPETHGAGTPENQHSSDPVIQQNGKRAGYPKVTYRLSLDAIDAVEDIKRTLRRQYSIKVNLEEIAEEAILAAYNDFLENQKNSILVRKFSGKPENKNSRR